MAILGTLLPNGKQQFIDVDGNPLVDGEVYFYIPNTSTPKNTWQDPEEMTLNTNPVVLDDRGQAIIYGTGQYRQVVLDVDGNTIWDQLTHDTLPTTLPSFQGALVYINADQSIPDGVATNIIFTTASYDTSSFWTVGAPTRITIPSGASRVQLTSNLQFEANGTSLRTIQINKNGSGVYVGRAGQYTATTTPNTATSLNCATAVLSVSPGDYFELQTQQNTGGALNAQATRTWLSVAVIT